MTLKGPFQSKLLYDSLILLSGKVNKNIAAVSRRRCMYTISTLLLVLHSGIAPGSCIIPSDYESVLTLEVEACLSLDTVVNCRGMCIKIFTLP